MSRRLLEELSGVGEIQAGALVLRSTPYQLEVWGEETDASHLAHPVIEGHIDIAGIAEAVVLAGPEGLTLKLEDGRRLPFSITDTGGKIVGRGFHQAA
ncbi:MAG TPA: hypothetical protein VES67_19490 [Vicinamibacterales bacterium]|nr:hypothetical protein [Vicinamibacterales bacterium]